jgi:hypothetical protein
LLTSLSSPFQFSARSVQKLWRFRWWFFPSTQPTPGSNEQVFQQIKNRSAKSHFERVFPSECARTGSAGSDRFTRCAAGYIRCAWLLRSYSSAWSCSLSCWHGCGGGRPRRIGLRAVCKATRTVTLPIPHPRTVASPPCHLAAGTRSPARELQRRGRWLSFLGGSSGR